MGGHSGQPGDKAWSPSEGLPHCYVFWSAGVGSRSQIHRSAVAEAGGEREMLGLRGGVASSESAGLGGGDEEPGS